MTFQTPSFNTLYKYTYNAITPSLSVCLPLSPCLSPLSRSHTPPQMSLGIYTHTLEFPFLTSNSAQFVTAVCVRRYLSNTSACLFNQQPRQLEKFSVSKKALHLHIITWKFHLREQFEMARSSQFQLSQHFKNEHLASLQNCILFSDRL